MALEISFCYWKTLVIAEPSHYGILWPRPHGLLSINGIFHHKCHLKQLFVFKWPTQYLKAARRALDGLRHIYRGESARKSPGNYEWSGHTIRDVSHARSDELLVLRRLGLKEREGDGRILDSVSPNAPSGQSINPPLGNWPRPCRWEPQTCRGVPPSPGTSGAVSRRAPS